MAAFFKPSNNFPLFRSLLSTHRSLVSKSLPRCHLKLPRVTYSSSSLVPVNQGDQQLEEIKTKILEESSKEIVQLNKFIPVTRQMLVKTLTEDKKLLSPDERENIESLSAALDICISQQFYSQLEEMKLLYDNLDPDKDTIQSKRITKKELLDDEYWLLQKLDALLYKANFLKVPQDKLIKLLKEHNTDEGVKVSVDPQYYAILNIWTRGYKTASLSIWEKLQLGVRKVLSFRRNSGEGVSNIDKVYTRVFVALRSKRERKLHFKVFKDMPCHQLEYLLPDGKIKMSNFDKGFLTSSVFLGSVIVAAKAITLASDFHMDYLWVGLGLAGLIGARGWLGYKNKRNSYLVNLSRTLYFKTVSNNRGVLTLLTDRAQDEEFKESLLAYTFLLSPPNRRGVPGLAYTANDPIFDTQNTLKNRIEMWLSDKLSITDVTFDISDALAKLDTMGLLVRHADETLSVVPMGVALETLPRAPFQWKSLGALRDSESAEDNNRTIDNTLNYHKGWR